MSRHFRQPDPAAAPTPEEPMSSRRGIDPTVPPDLPDHLVATPVARGLRRLGVGTIPFNIAAMVTLTAMSAFVVMSPSSIPGLSAPRELASVDRAEGSPRDQSRTSIPDRGDPRGTTTTDAPATTTATTPATIAPTTAAARSSTTARQRTTTPGANLVSTPVSARVPRCEDFSLQPDAQAAFDADPTGRAGFDGDGDGIACEQLPGRPLTSLPALTARKIPTIDQVRRPSTRLYGVHTPNAPYSTSELDAFTAAAKKAPNTVLFFQNFSQEFPASAVSSSWNRGMLPMISFEPIVQNSTEGQPLLADIAAGEWDTYFTRWATAAKAQGTPIALRFAQEMNGNWYSWSDGRFGNAPGDFVAAWRHLHQLFDAAGADNIVWVWSVNRIDNLPDKTIDRVYPGDDWVDWVGLSGYLRTVPDGVTPTFDFTFAQTLAAIAEVAPTKLVMLTEVGAGTTESNRVQWLQSFFQGMLDHPEIIGFNWFNDFKDGGDWRIQYSDATSAAFAAGVGDSRFGELAPVGP